MRGIDFTEARARLRIAEVLGLMNYEPRRLVGQQGRGSCPLHGARAGRPRVRGALAEEYLPLFCLWSRGQCLGLLGSLDAARSVCCCG